MMRVWDFKMVRKTGTVVVALGALAFMPLAAHAAIYTSNQNQEVQALDVGPHHIVPQGMDSDPAPTMVPAYERPPVESDRSPTTAHGEPVMSGYMGHHMRHRHHMRHGHHHHHARKHAA